MKFLKIWTSNYLWFLRYSHPKIKPLSENWPPYDFFCFWCHFQIPIIHSNRVTLSCFFQRWFETKPILQKKTKQKKWNYFFLGEMATILFLKKNFEKKFFFQVLRGQKSKIGSLYEFIPGFPKRLVFLSDCPETLWLWSMPFEMKVLKFEHLTIFCS